MDDQIPHWFRCPHSCLAGVGEVFGGQYSAPIRFSAPPQTVLDIGANVGAFAIWFRMQFETATIHCYEPDPDLFRLLVKNVEELDGIDCYCSAVGDPSLRVLYRGEHSPLCSSQYPGMEFVGTESIPISVQEPEGLSTAYDVVKIDAEGAEGYICEHLQFTPKLLFVEWHGDEQRIRVERSIGSRMNLIKTNVHHKDVGILTYVQHEPN